MILYDLSCMTYDIILLSYTLYGTLYSDTYSTRVRYVRTAGPGKDDPELTESTPAETKIVTIVLPSCIILKL